MKVKVYAVCGYGMYEDDFKLLAEYDVEEKVFEKQKQKFIEYWKEKIEEDKTTAITVGLLTKYPLDVNKLSIETDKEKIEIPIN